MKFRKSLLTVVAIGTIIAGLFGIQSPAKATIKCDFNIGDLVKIEGQPQVYGIGTDWKLRLFPNEDIFFGWNENFYSVQTMSPSCIEEFGLGKPMPYRPGSTLVKTPFDATVYVVEPGAILRPIESEESLVQLFGTTWFHNITTISEPEFLLYTINTTKEVPTISEGTLIRPFGDVFVYVVQYGTVYRIEGTLPTQLESHVQKVPLAVFNDYVASHSLLGATDTVIPTIALADVLKNEFERTTAIQLPHEQLQVNNSFRAELMAKTMQNETFIRLTPTIVGEPAPEELLEMTILMKTMSDMRTCGNEKSAITMETDLWLHGSDVPIGITAEFRVFEQPMALYLNITELDLRALTSLMEEEDATLDEVLVMLNSLTNQWIKLDIAAPSALGGTPLSELMPSCEEQAALKEAGASIIGNSNVLIVTDNFGTETVDGQEYYHYGFSVNPRSLKYILSALAAETNSPLTSNDLMEMNNMLDELEGMFETRNGMIMLSKETGIIHALTLDVIIRDEFGIQSGSMQIEYLVTELDGDVMINEPENATDAVELLTNLLMNSYTSNNEYTSEEAWLYEDTAYTNL